MVEGKFLKIHQQINAHELAKNYRASPTVDFQKAARVIKYPTLGYQAKLMLQSDPLPILEQIWDISQFDESSR